MPDTVKFKPSPAFSVSVEEVENGYIVAVGGDTPGVRPTQFVAARHAADLRRVIRDVVDAAAESIEDHFFPEPPLQAARTAKAARAYATPYRTKSVLYEDDGA